uniref:Uncharacterized protein n=1 Tax=viral metagenome TaxID=1070528 RepID=A0A6C0BMU1_9ZZZZ
MIYHHLIINTSALSNIESIRSIIELERYTREDTQLINSIISIIPIITLSIHLSYELNHNITSSYDIIQ